MFLKSKCHQFCLFRVCKKRRGPQMLESIRTGVGDEWNGRQTSETNFVFYPPVKILLSSQKLRFGIFDFPKESFLYKFKCSLWLDKVWVMTGLFRTSSSPPIICENDLMCFSMTLMLSIRPWHMFDFVITRPARLPYLLHYSSRYSCHCNVHSSIISRK